MTPEALRAARIAEAWRRSDGSVADTLEHLADLYETNWTPPESVDPDLLALRVWLKDCGRYSHRSVDAGELDNEAVGRAYLAGCTRGREGAKGLVEAAETLVGILENAWPNLVRLAPVERLRKALASAKRGG